MAHNKPHVMKKKLLQKFWEKVSISAGPDACWEWKACIGGNGYGRFGIGCKVHQAHRIAFELAGGTVPKGHFVLHKCDNRKCCNPRHLYAGTAKQNTADMFDRGRSVFHRCPEKMPRAEKHGRAKLTNDQVQQIRERYARGGISQDALAAEYGLRQCNISALIRRVTWKDVA